MGTLVSLYEINNNHLLDLKQRRLLRRLVDVVSGHKSPESVGLPANYVFKTRSMDKSWADIYYLLHGLMPINNYHFDNFYLYYTTKISHKDYFAFYYKAEQVLWVLISHRRLAEEVAKASRLARNFPTHHVDFAYTSRGNTEWVKTSIVQLKAVPQTADLIRDFAHQGVKKHLSGGSPITNGDAEPFDHSDVDYLMDYYGALIQFMTESVYRVENGVAVPIHAGIVGVRS